MSSPGGPQGSGANDSDYSIIKIDPDGDLILIVGKPKTHFLVCSKTLSRSADFWKRCLYAQFSESKPADGQEWVVEFPQDNPSGFECLLLLVHGLGHKLPQIDLELAFVITVTTNKYDMTRSLWAVVGPWLAALRPKRLDEGDDDTIVPQLQWLWVTKELGDCEKHSETFLDLTQMVSTTADAESHLLLRPYAPGDKEMLSRDTMKYYDNEKEVLMVLADEIKVAREQALSGIQFVLKWDMQLLRYLIRDFDSSKGCKGAHICKGSKIDGLRVHPNQQRLCEYAMQGIISKMSTGQNSPMKPLVKINMSVEDFLESAVCFISRIENEIVLVSGEEHKKCTPFTSSLPTLPFLREKTLRIWTLEFSEGFKMQAQISGLRKGDPEDEDKQAGAPGSRLGSRKRSHVEFEDAASE